MNYPEQVHTDEESLEAYEDVYRCMMQIQSKMHVLSFERLLEYTIERTIEMLSSFESGYVSIYDNEKNLLIPIAAVGLKNYIYEVQTSVGESVTGKVYEQGTAMIFYTRDALYEAMQHYNITESNYNSLLKADLIPTGSICLPIMVNNERIGVIMLHRWDAQREISKVCIQKLKLLMQGVSNLIYNAKTIDQMRRQLVQVERQRKELLIEREQFLDRNILAQNIMNNIVQYEDIYTLLNDVGNNLPFPYCYVDYLTGMEYYYDSHTKKLMKGFIKKEQLVKEDVPVMYEQTVIGGFLYDDQTAETAILEQFSSYIKAYVHNTYSQLQKERDEARQLMTVLQRGLPSVEKEIEQFTDQHYVVIRLEHHNYLGAMFQKSNIKQSLKNLAKANSIIDCTKKECIILAYHTETIEMADLLKAIEIIVSKNPFERRVAISNQRENIFRFSNALKETDELITYLKRNDRFEVLAYEQLGVERLLVTVRERQLQRYVQETLGPLLNLDKHTNELLRTLNVYMATNRSAKKAAKQLYIHLNTLYQRLEKIEKLLGVQFQAATSLLEIELALYILNISSGSKFEGL